MLQHSGRRNQYKLKQPTIWIIIKMLIMRKVIFLLVLIVILSPVQALLFSTDFKNGEGKVLSGKVIWLSTDSSGVARDITSFCKNPDSLSLQDGEIKQVICIIESPEYAFGASGNYRIRAMFDAGSIKIPSKEKSFEYGGCSSCEGILCSQEKCSILGSCLFKKSAIGGDCVSCKGEGITTCEDYGSNQATCLTQNPCKLENCIWNGEKCMTKRALKILVVPLVSGEGKPIRTTFSDQGNIIKHQLFTFTKEPNLFGDYFASGLSAWFPGNMDISIESTEPLDISRLDLTSGATYTDSILEYATAQKKQDFDIVIATLESMTRYEGNELDNSPNIEVLDGLSIGKLQLIPFYQVNAKLDKDLLKNLEKFDDEYMAENLAHELGHFFGLCDEGYATGDLETCSSKIATCKESKPSTKSDGSASSCLICSSGPCCPNKPEKNSLMCSYDGCERGCTSGSFFAKSSKCHLVKELANNGYCDYDSKKENEYCN